jgi:8-oxo-dGTP diphosphatase
MIRYSGQSRILLAIDCLIFGFDNANLKLLLVQRAMEPKRHKWSLIGGFLQPDETLDDSAKRVLKSMTGLTDVYMEPLRAFSEPRRDPVERTVSVAYFALIDISEYDHRINNQYRAEWFILNEIPELIFDHRSMVEAALTQIKYRASQHPILFELLPQQFTLPELQVVYENIYGQPFDHRNFHRKFLSTGLLVKQNEKNRVSSRKGAYYYKIDRERYLTQFNSFLNILSHSRGYLIDKNNEELM